MKNTAPVEAEQQQDRAEEEEEDEGGDRSVVVVEATVTEEVTASGTEIDRSTTVLEVEELVVDEDPIEVVVVVVEVWCI